MQRKLLCPRCAANRPILLDQDRQEGWGELREWVCLGNPHPWEEFVCDICDHIMTRGEIAQAVTIAKPNERFSNWTMQYGEPISEHAAKLALTLIDYDPNKR